MTGLRMDLDRVARADARVCAPDPSEQRRGSVDVPVNLGGDDRVRGWVHKYPPFAWLVLRGAALGLPLARLISSALRDWQTRVTGKGDVPRGACATEVGGAPPCLVELRIPAGSAEPWLRTQLQPRSIRRPFRHETQNMPLCWPRPSRAVGRIPSRRMRGGRESSLLDAGYDAQSGSAAQRM